MLIYKNLGILSKLNPDKICLIHGDTSLSYRDLAYKTDQIAYCLSCVHSKGERIIIRHPDPIMQICILIGASKAGLASVLTDVNTPENVLKSLVSVTNCKTLIDSEFDLSRYQQGNLPEVDQEDIFLGALSSGSTGIQKLIWRDHKSWTSAFSSQSVVFNLDSRDTLFIAGSLVYTANLNSCLHMLYEGGTVVIANNYSPKGWLDEIQKFKVSSLFMVPSNYQILLKAIKNSIPDISSLVSAGSKLDISILKQLIQFFPNALICEYYGASELGHVSFAYSEDLLKHPDSVGKAFPNVKLWTKDNVIWVESPYIAPEYRPRATVGDIGIINDDGCLFLQGRENEIINKGGVKIIPEQVEKVLSLCPGVFECAVKGISDKAKGQKVAAWIIRSSSSKVTLSSLRSFCNKNLPVHLRPQVFRFVDKIPKTSKGRPDPSKLL